MIRLTTTSYVLKIANGYTFILSAATYFVLSQKRPQFLAKPHAGELTSREHKDLTMHYKQVEAYTTNGSTAHELDLLLGRTPLRK